ncbi:MULTISPECIES: aminomethyl-transferring glycine dehydrogenase subunit GcvPB [unclassified Oceanispirochaeta]|uniref:aminomethyl-transferring glycine dehydrogenase subunit GcvPB n=1 Tax=unclassified Oceanispirochaeta TaxID=2635722 RepID=UPI000E094B27|nr:MULTISPECIES: aminomethyl-transferring glycine dehydrogenase subunit GcvPB [unclassified Oceanispirochaeta]MBF9014391.1 aminomethyl-transferring glycine dehydrogenase subunit GcvPB [Oceanispirochaeta sp. M2]NPD71277.1 aminomethyl-transferring glycine dehydrogenase subunit GcvPB [Oceanispirochaeta sp. M1]RDG33660.1 glycine dehydrogenase subunit 2 [Oceanispirochaeta sp. M1]
MDQNKISSLWELSSSGRRAVRVPASDVPKAELDEKLARKVEPELPEVSELDLIRHYTRLSTLNYSIDTRFYPLGSCTMKYNPRLNEQTARMAGFAASHPYAPESLVQGNLELLYELQNGLSELAGFKATSLQPAAGAHGELAGVLMIKKYHVSRGDKGRTRFLIPDSAHGTNPASVAMGGFEAVELPSDGRGNIDLSKLKELCDESIAGIMITNPNTLGLFEEQIIEVIETVHACGGLVYGDGANLNAIMGVVKPGELGFDVMHYNLHKTFSTPHGGGGPGAGPVGAADSLKDFLPGPIVVVSEDDPDSYTLAKPEKSIGRLKGFNGNFGVLVRAYTYFLSLGGNGLRDASESAVLGANYLMSKVKDILPPWYDRICMHEFVSSGQNLAEGVHTMDLAKRLIDYGFHPPTVYFPLIVPEALMVEPTETESLEILDAFADTLRIIVKESQENPQLLHDAPHREMVSRLDEVMAVKKPVLRDILRL